MSLLPASETKSLLLPAERDEIGTFAERARDFAAQASVAGEGGVDEVWVVCRHVTPSWAARSIWIDRYAAERVCGGIVHIEAVFRNRATSEMIAYTVDKPNPREPGSGFVRLVAPDARRTYPAPTWTCHKLSSLSPAERYGMLAFMQRQVDKPFNYGMYWNFLPVLGPLFAGESEVEETHYFCSQLIASALRWIRPTQYATIEPRRCTPAILHAILSAERSDELSLFRPVDTLEL